MIMMMMRVMIIIIMMMMMMMTASVKQPQLRLEELQACGGSLKSSGEWLSGIL